MQNLKVLDDNTLLSRTKSLALEERKITVELIRHLQEVQHRRLFSSLGFSSLFEYCTREIGYSEASAQRRISAMHLVREIPEVEEKIISGQLNLTTVSQAQSFFRAESKVEKPYDVQAKKEILQKLEGKSTRAAERELLKISPEFEPKEKVRAISESKTELRIVVDSDLQSDLNQIRNLLSHKNPNMSYVELLREMAKITLGQIDPVRRAESKSSKIKSQSQGVAGLRRSASPAPAVKRNIPTDLKREVWQRDQGKCTYVDKTTGRICESKFQLQIDHVQAWAHGGENTKENLRLLCANHNRWAAIQTFGMKKMEKYLNKGASLGL